MTWLADLDRPGEAFSARGAVKALVIWLCVLAAVVALVAAVLFLAGLVQIAAA